MERDAINTGPVYRRTVPHSEAIAPVILSNHTSWWLSFFLLGESVSACNMSCCVVNIQDGLYRTKRGVERRSSKLDLQVSPLASNSDI